jgi:multicomponent Na+:H+ antiporter subunit E
MYSLFVFLILLVSWVVFSGIFDVFHIVLGVICSGIVTWMSADLFFEDRSRSGAQRFKEVIRLPGYLLWLLWEIVIANVHVLKLAFSPDLDEEISPSMQKVKVSLKTDFARYVFANSITLTPGTVTVKVSKDEFLVHAISREAAEGLFGEMERRVARAFEPENPIAAKA